MISAVPWSLGKKSFGFRINNREVLSSISMTVKQVYKSIVAASQAPVVYSNILSSLERITKDQHKWKVMDANMKTIHDQLKKKYLSEIQSVSPDLFHWLPEKHIQWKIVDVKSVMSQSGFVPGYSIPVTLPVNLTRESVDKVLNNPRYMMAYTVKSDGMRFLMCMGKLGIEEEPCVVLIDRVGSVIQLRDFRIPECLLQGTVLDVELVDDHILVFDCLMVCGNIIGHFNKHWRNHMTRAILEWMNGASIARTHPSSLYVATVKNFCPGLCISQKREWAVWDFYDIYMYMMKYSDHPLDGFIATALETPTFPGAQKTVLKYKSSHTLDFVAKLVSNTKCTDERSKDTHFEEPESKSETAYNQDEVVLDDTSHSNGLMDMPLPPVSGAVFVNPLKDQRKVPSLPVHWLFILYWLRDRSNTHPKDVSSPETASKTAIKCSSMLSPDSKLMPVVYGVFNPPRSSSFTLRTTNILPAKSNTSVSPEPSKSMAVGSSSTFSCVLVVPSKQDVLHGQSWTTQLIISSSSVKTWLNG